MFHDSNAASYWADETLELRASLLLDARV